MECSLTQDQRLIQESVCAALASASARQNLRAVLSSPVGWDQGLWETLAGEMGYAGLMIPEVFGGSGLGAVEMSVLLEQTGRTLAVVPYFETAVLFVQALLAAGHRQQQDAWLPRVAQGQLKATLAFMGSAGHACPADIQAVLTGANDHWRLSGEASYVSFGHLADLILIAARAPASTGWEGISLIALPQTTPGLVCESLNNLDRTRPFARLRFQDIVVTEDAILGAPERAGPALERTLSVAAGLLAAEQTGGAAFCLDATVDYAKQRMQFGRTIGSFQAVKHTLADMMVQVEAARAAALYAAVAIDDGGPELQEATAIARAACTDAYQHCAGEAIQLHGGIGFTWEHHAHLYFKRAQSSASWLGTASVHRERLAQLIGLDVAP